jgi:mRNA interferase HigB
MHIISRKALHDFSEVHPDAAEPLDAWYRLVRNAQWRNIQDTRGSYRHADGATVRSGNVVTIFNIGGNKYRLVAAIHYNRGKVFILKIMTHREYNLNRWKETL